jgi:hypothetical protein
MPEIRAALNDVNSNFGELYASGVDAPQGRLTLASGTPIMTTSVAAATTIYYTPYTGQLCPIFDGANFNMVDLGGELANVTTDATKNPAAVIASNAYDLFVWSDNGVPRLGRGPVWTGNTRNLALTRVRGILVNSAAITNGPAALGGTYVGTVFVNSALGVDWVYGTAATGGGAASLFVWNMYNRRQIITRVTDSQSPYTYSAAAVRQAGGSGTNQIMYVTGLAEDAPTFTYQTIGTTAAAAGAAMQTSVGDDSTTAFEVPGSYNFAPTAAAVTNEMTSMYYKASTEPLIGWHFAAPLEKGDGTNVCTYNVGPNAELAGALWM